MVCALSLAVCLAWMPGIAMASHSATGGVDSCSGPRIIVLQPGEVADLQACFRQAGQPLGDHAVLFVEDGPSPKDVFSATTDVEGKASFTISSPRAGRSFISVCDADICMAPLVVTWQVPGVRSFDESVPEPDLTGGPFIEDPAPRVANLAVTPLPTGFVCETAYKQGPQTSRISAPTAGSESAPLPAYASIAEVIPHQAANPLTHKLVPSLTIKTGQNVAAGSAVYGLPAVVSVALIDPDLPVDTLGQFPLRGFNRMMTFWTDGSGRFGKTESVFNGIWSQTDASFAVLLVHSEITFFTDGRPFSSNTASASPSVAASTGGVCSASGFQDIVLPVSKPGGVAVKNLGPKSATAIGMALLILLGGLVAAVMGAGRAPSGGVVVDTAYGPVMKVQRSDSRYDQHGRVTSFVEIVELSDGTTRTLRTTVTQESLFTDLPTTLDVEDWEDEQIEIFRKNIERDSHGRATRFVEEFVALDGTTLRSQIANVGYDQTGRVVRYDRATGVHGSSRFEVFTISYDEPVQNHQGPHPGPHPGLATYEKVDRKALRFDDEGHVSGYMSWIWCRGGVEDLPDTAASVDDPGIGLPAPKVLYQLGENWPMAPVFRSADNTGFERFQNVLTRWFRRHGCKVSVVIDASEQTASSDMRILLSGKAATADKTGSTTFWAMQKGIYSLTSATEPNADDPMSGSVGETLLAWIVVNHIPGRVDATIHLSKVKQAISQWN